MSMHGLERSKIKAVIFDLDGTLIDSASAILEGLEYTLNKAGVIPVQPLTNSLIGPPLKETLLRLVGEEVDVNVDSLIANFKNFYDQEGFKKSRPYPGIEKVLRVLSESGLVLYLATNKRLVPTQKIINYFGWKHFFDEIYTIDKFVKFPFKTKTLMIQKLIKEKLIDPANAIYVGDREEDQLASISNNMPSILVAWGYGDFQKEDSGGMTQPSTPEELLSIIMEKK